MSTTTSSTPPDAIMLLGTHCPHCPAVLNGLTTLLKEGVVGSLKVINAEQRPDLAAELGAQTIPWVRLGPFELEGFHTEKELRKWAGNTGSATGMAAWLDELLSSGNIGKANTFIQSNPETIHALLGLFSDPEVQLNIRIGISAVIEELQGSKLLRSVAGELGALTQNTDARIRGDACYYLSLTGEQQAVKFIKPLLHDEDADIKELAQESLQQLEEMQNSQAE